MESVLKSAVIVFKILYGSTELAANPTQKGSFAHSQLCSSKQLGTGLECFLMSFGSLCVGVDTGV